MVTYLKKFTLISLRYQGTQIYKQEHESVVPAFQHFHAPATLKLDWGAAPRYVSLARTLTFHCDQVVKDLYFHEKVMTAITQTRENSNDCCLTKKKNLTKQGSQSDFGQHQHYIQNSTTHCMQRVAPKDVRSILDQKVTANSQQEGGRYGNCLF